MYERRDWRLRRPNGWAGCGAPRREPLRCPSQQRSKAAPGRPSPPTHEFGSAIIQADVQLPRRAAQQGRDARLGQHRAVGVDWSRTMSLAASQSASSAKRGVEHRFAAAGQADAAQAARAGLVQERPGAGPTYGAGGVDGLAAAEKTPGVAGVDPVQLDVIGPAVDRALGDAARDRVAIFFAQVLPAVHHPSRHSLVQANIRLHECGMWNAQRRAIFCRREAEKGGGREGIAMCDPNDTISPGKLNSLLQK